MGGGLGEMTPDGRVLQREVRLVVVVGVVSGGGGGSNSCVVVGVTTAAAGRGQRQRLDDEVVVDAVAGRVVRGVIDDVAAKRHVAHGGREAVLRYPGGLKALVADLRRRIQRGGDAGGDGVVFHPDHHRICGSVPDERAAAATGFEHPAAGESRMANRSPHRCHDGRVGVVGVEHRRLGAGVFVAAKQCAQPVTLDSQRFVARIEHLGHRAPPRPGRQHPLLGRGGRPIGPAHALQGFDGGDVGAGSGLRARGHQCFGGGREIGGAVEGLIDRGVDGSLGACRDLNRGGGLGSGSGLARWWGQLVAAGIDAARIGRLIGVVKQRRLRGYRSGRPSWRRSLYTSGASCSASGSPGSLGSGSWSSASAASR
jgi:hypothetical protein